MTGFLFRGGRFLDPRKDALQDGIELLTEGGRVKEVSDRPIKASSATVVDLKGRTLMPGLIDCHVHVYLAEVDIRRLENHPPTYMAFLAVQRMRAMLERGFTTVRDTGGADFGLRDALEHGLVQGPRLSIAGRILSPTGGHGDSRRKTATSMGALGGSCLCCDGLGMGSRIVDGTAAVLEACRDELRKGADFIKIMASGGVASPNDPLEGIQFTKSEVKAIVEEVTNWGRYVAAHTYGADAIYRAVDLGIRTVEHGNFIDKKAAKLMAEKGAFLVPNLIAYDAMKRRAKDYGMSAAQLAKNDRVYEAGLKSIEIARRADVQIAYGSDLLGALHDDQTKEFQIRAEVMPLPEIIRSATIVGARLLRMEGEVGELKPGAHADLLVVDGDPYKDATIWQDGGPRVPAIMQAGAFYRNRL